MKEIFIILDCLMTDEECYTQIKEYFALSEMEIDDMSLRKILNDMLLSGLITANPSWCNENYEIPYSLTAKGKEKWEAMEKQYYE